MDLKRLNDTEELPLDLSRSFFSAVVSRRSPTDSSATCPVAESFLQSLVTRAGRGHSDITLAANRGPQSPDLKSCSRIT